MTTAQARLLVAALMLVAVSGLTATRVQAAPGPVPAGPAPLTSAPSISAPSLPCLPIVSCDPASALAGDAARTAARAGLDALGGWVSDGAVAVLDQVGADISGTTRPTVNAAWFTSHVGVMRTLGVLVVLPLLLASMISAILHQDPGRLVRAVAVHLPLALFGGFVAVQLTAMALSLTDGLCSVVTVGMHNDVSRSIANIGLAMRAVSAPTANPVTGGFLAFLIAVLVAIGALLIWLELLVRSSAIYVAVMFLPLTLSGLVWPVTARWAKRLIEILVALVLSKFVVVAVISLATSAVASDPRNGLAAGMTGAGLLLMAGFAPFALLRLVPVVEATVVGHLEGSSHRPLAAGVTSTQMVHRMVRNAGPAGPSGVSVATDTAADAGGTIAAVVARGDPGLLAGFPSSPAGGADRGGGAGTGSDPDRLSSVGAGPARGGGGAAPESFVPGVESDERRSQGG